MLLLPDLPGHYGTDSAAGADDQRRNHTVHTGQRHQSRNKLEAKPHTQCNEIEFPVHVLFICREKYNDSHRKMHHGIADPLHAHHEDLYRRLLCQLVQNHNGQICFRLSQILEEIIAVPLVNGYCHQIVCRHGDSQHPNCFAATLTCAKHHGVIIVIQFLSQHTAVSPQPAGFFYQRRNHSHIQRIDPYIILNKFTEFSGQHNNMYHLHQHKSGNQCHQTAGKKGQCLRLISNPDIGEQAKGQQDTHQHNDRQANDRGQTNRIFHTNISSSAFELPQPLFPQFFPTHRLSARICLLYTNWFGFATIITNFAVFCSEAF